MSTETRMAIEQSQPMPKSNQRGVSARHETTVLSHWDGRGRAEVVHASTYELHFPAYIPEWSADNAA
jgi:hypothetical protein